MTNPLSADLDHILEHTRDLWGELRGERIFITGGTGFFGCWLLESLLWANDRLDLDCHATVLSRSPELFRAKAPHLAKHKIVSLLQGDVGTFDFPPGTFSHVIHAATYTHPRSSSSDPLLLYRANIQGTQHTLDFATICRAQKFLFTSSGAVYGSQPPEMTHIPEDYPGAPATTDLRTVYGQSKRSSEFLCAARATSGLQTKIARCFAFVGPHLPLDSNYAIGNFIRDALGGNCIHIQSDGTPYRSYLYTADLTIWLWTILIRGQSSHPYNVGSESDLTIGDLAKAVASVIAPTISIQVAQQHIDHKPVERYVPLTQRAKSELGLQEFINLSEAIQRTAQWYTPSYSKG
jgi:dTDP-glucose 4,6-dehydratase